tara:strand:- start:5178 stop:5324 length:147 start_codon:yes stop_codon:yes gene_type:complete
MKLLFIIIILVIIIIFISNFIINRIKKTAYLKASKKWDGVVKELRKRK